MSFVQLVTLAVLQGIDQLQGGFFAVQIYLPHVSIAVIFEFCTGILHRAVRTQRQITHISIRLRTYVFNLCQ